MKFNKFAILLLLSSPLVWGEFKLPKPEPEAKQAARDQAVVQKLSNNANAIAIYARGLCCSSCAIGVRKSVGQLNFVDQERFKKGIDLDAKVQVATVAVKKGVSFDSIDRSAIAEAIDDAGYDPVHLYSMNDGQLKTESIALK